MRKVFVYLLSLSFLLLASCAKEQEEPDIPPVPEDDLPAGTMSFKVQTTEPESKVALDGLSIDFEVGDALAIWDGVALRKFVAEDSGEGIVFTGEAAQVDTYWAFYPWSSDCLVTPVEGTPVWEATLPDTQHAVAGGFDPEACFGVGKGGSDHIINLKNVCAYIKFSFPAAAVPALGPGSLSSISLTSLAGEKLSGEFRVSLDGSDNPVYTSDNASGDDEIEIRFDEVLPAAGSTYYYSVLPVDLSGGISLDFARSADRAVASRSGGAKPGNIIERNTVVNLGALSPKWTPSDGEEADDASSVSSGTFNYSMLSAERHPRILMSDEDFRRLNALLGSGSYPELTARHNKVITYAESLLGQSIPTLATIISSYPSYNTQKNRHLEELARPALAHLFNCAYAYRTTGQTKYLTECKTVLIQLCADENWYPSSFLSTAEIALGVAVAYDWLYYDLTKAERTTIRSSLVSKAILARGATTLSPLNNTGQVHNTGLVAAALAVWEKDKSDARSLLEESISNMPDIVAAIYEPRGSYSEGYSYWNYGTSYQCIYDEMLLTAFGDDQDLSDNTGFRESANYRLFMSDRVAPFSYSDGGRSNVGASTAMWWYAAHYQQPSLLLNELALGADVSDGRYSALVPLSLSKYTALNTGSVTPPAQSVWVDSNTASAPVLMVRKGWTGSNDDVYLGLKGGQANINHGHMDAGSFVYHAQGVLWSADIQQKAYATYTEQGLSGSSQTSGTWKALVYNSLGHSTISFANYSGATEKIHPTDHIVSGKATIYNSWTSGDALGGELDLTPLFAGQASSVRRKAIILSDGSLKIEDRIQALAGTDAELIWRMVTPATVAIAGDEIVLTRGGKTMYLSTRCTSGSISDLTLCNWGAYAEARPTGGTWGWNDTVTWDENHSGYYITGFTLTVPKNTTAVITTILSSTRPLTDASQSAGFQDITDGDDFQW